MSLVALKLSSKIATDPALPGNPPVSQSVEFAAWDTVGNTAYTYSAGGIPLEDNVQTWLTANIADLWAQVQSNGQEMPHDVEGRATLLQEKAMGTVAVGCVAGTLRASSLFAGFGQAKKNAINTALDSAATLENTFMSAPGLVL